MKKILISFGCITTLILTGCGSSEDTQKNETNTTKHTVVSLNEPYVEQQWYIRKNTNFYETYEINPDAHIHIGDIQKTYSGKTIKVAVIDNGLDMNHRDLYKALIASYDSATKTTNVNHTDFNEYHGTAVTGIIAARNNNIGMLGIAYNVSLIFLKYKDEMTDSETIELFNKAESFGADIINCSWGTYDVSDAVKDKIVDLSKHGRNGKGTLIVFASGNDDYNLDDYNDESNIPEVISVGATDKENLRAYYSNYGTNLDLVAPGGYDLALPTLDVTGAAGENSGDYIFYDGDFQGTSAAAPVVSGVLALLLEKNPNLTHDEVISLLKTKSDQIGNVPYDEHRFNPYYGYGKINVSKLFETN
jgi:subtilisin family serine protease